MSKSYKSVSEMLHDTDDPDEKQFAIEFDAYQATWRVRFNKWRFLTWMRIRTFLYRICSGRFYND